MTNRTVPSPHQALGEFVWEYITNQYNPQSYLRFALALAFPGLIIIYAGITLGQSGWLQPSMFFLLPAFVFVGLAFRARKYRILFYERGVEELRNGKIRSSSYEDLKIWQYTQTNDIRGISPANIHSYIVEFPDKSILRSFEAELGEQFQRCITQCQTTLMIANYEKGEAVDFGPIQINQQGIISSLDRLGKLQSSFFSSGALFFPTSSTAINNPRCQLIPWSDVGKIRLISGTLYIPKSQGKSIDIKVADIPNCFVLLNLLQHLGYFST
jgi:hypothetical protein